MRLGIIISNAVMKACKAQIISFQPAKPVDHTVFIIGKVSAKENILIGYSKGIYRFYVREIHIFSGLEVNSPKIIRIVFQKIKISGKQEFATIRRKGVNTVVR